MSVGSGVIFQQIRAQAAAMEPELTALRRDLHRHPEPGWMEFRSSARIARALTEMGCDQVLVGASVCDRDSRLGVPPEAELEARFREAEANGADPDFLSQMAGGMTGVIGILRCGPGPVVALRFDIDALPVTEAEGPDHRPWALGFRSEVPGGVSRLRARRPHRHRPGHGEASLRPAGAASGHREIHLSVCGGGRPRRRGDRGKGPPGRRGPAVGGASGGEPGQPDAIGVGPNRTLATSKLDVLFHGKAAHAALVPDAGNNAMLSAATAILNLHAIPRFGAAPTRVNVGRVSAGSGRNVICDRALLELEVRGLTTEANEYMTDYAKRIVEAAARMHGCSCEITLRGQAAGDRNDPALCQRVLALCGDPLGLAVTELPEEPMGYISEDYSLLAARVRAHGGQSCYFKNLTACAAAIHDPRFDFPERALVAGVTAFAGLTAALTAAGAGS